MRVKRGVTARKRHKRLLKTTKGYRGLSGKTWKMARQAFFKAGQHSFIDRRKKRRVFRSLWIQRINAACRQQGMSYSVFMSKLREKNITLNRKMLSEMAFSDIANFEKLLKSVA
ncbi:MAG: 50S ribosomal protein L20 [Candidatus Abawacabacteria bacterium RBG_16_42_10]|uniref:Large ribosomal subunit protein bL20 n=1 Tax=Candidatus Abawacabacteria bacterium RBG_16_42_10 TaxID=1817814 RepID=A0A1F4XJP0_9BACT|nr:MAG: 50S ribosomal protein L20 [Candidatus Abawacabacteria bacterium RBG_16_42_10]